MSTKCITCGRDTGGELSWCSAACAGNDTRFGLGADNEMRRLRAENARLREQVKRLREATKDMLSGWRYIRMVHGDLYGVGWDRAQSAVEQAIAATEEKACPKKQ